MKSKILIGIVILVGIGTSFWFMRSGNIFGRLDILYQNPNATIRHFAPTWRALKKISDVYYLPTTFFHISKLPHYELTLSRKDFRALLDSLPTLTGGKPFLTEENRQTVLAEFHADGFAATARVRPRGLLPNHWSAGKKSWNINFVNNKFQNRSALRLFIPEDRGWAAEFLEAYRARKFGVLTPDLKFVNLTINGKDYGVYTNIENWEPAFFENKGRAIGGIFAELDVEHPRDIFRLDAIDSWQERIDPALKNHRTAFAYFLYVISETSDKEFARRIPSILNMDAYYGWALEALLARNYHSKNEGNLNFYFDPSRGTFEPIAYDMFSWELGEQFEVAHNRLLNRIMAHEPFRKAFEQKAQEYINNPDNLADDLAYYDSVAKSIEKDIAADTAKLPPTQEFFATYKEHRRHIIANVEKIKLWFADGASLPISFADEAYPLNASNIREYDFSTFDAISATDAEFVQMYPQFYPIQLGVIGIGPGKFRFTRDVIIPKGLNVIIRPNTELYLEPGISVVSYSPIEARGTATQPIGIKAASFWLPWGSFALVNTGKKSIFTHTDIAGGSSDVINGIVLEDALSLHNAEIEFQP
ncbi:MAG TPA: CotH kinase family protein [Candidatus Paceibacterota bacterium]